VVQNLRNSLLLKLQQQVSDISKQDAVGDMACTHLVPVELLHILVEPLCHREHECTAKACYWFPDKALVVQVRQPA
jgi:hypothetical protein